jgi:hypothetical protein
MLGTLLEASRPGRNWPSVRDARALVAGGLRVRGWTWSLSMLWVAAGTVITGYIFYTTTPNYASADIAGTGLIGFNAGPAAVQIVAVLALAAWVALSPFRSPGSSGFAAGGRPTGSARPRGQVHGLRAPFCLSWPTLGEIRQGSAGENWRSASRGWYSGP